MNTNNSSLSLKKIVTEIIDRLEKKQHTEMIDNNSSLKNNIQPAVELRHYHSSFTIAKTSVVYAAGKTSVVPMTACNSLTTSEKT